MYGSGHYSRSANYFGGGLFHSATLARLRPSALVEPDYRTCSGLVLNLSGFGVNQALALLFFVTEEEFIPW